ncbi:MAG TPA: hypothetical protein VGM60_10005 [Pseudonocardia sp.]|uniref:hypothetical protein n=1 Tax=Pseudonocardia sp. TaxID=60912 RepID=UPI002F42ACA2
MSQPRTHTGEPSAPEESDLGGDPVCWLHLVCPECGRFAPESAGEVCAGCGAELML